MGGYLEYPEYKDSGVEWLGKIPAHWTCGVKLIYLAATHRHSFVNGPFGSDLLTSELTNEGVPVIYSGDVKPGRFFRKSDKYVTPEKAKQLNFCRVDPGDLLLAKVGDPPGDAAMYPENAPSGIVTQDVVRVKIEPKEAFPSYVCYFMNSKAGHYIVRQISVEATRGRFSLGDFKSIRIFMPPLAEQESIARFLDYKTAQIDALIAKKENLLAKLAEKRTALISQAVTKGLDPTVPMKDSGIEWLGDIPAHWDVAKLLYVSESIQTGPFGSQLHADEYIEGGTPIVNPADICEGELLYNPKTTVSSEVVERLSRHKLQLKDIVLGRRGEIGRAGLVKEEHVDWLCGSGSMRIRLRREKLEPTYLLSQFSIPKVAGYLTLQSVGSTMDNLSGSIVGRLHVLLPPLEEQNQISKAVQQIRDEMLISSSKIQDAIAKLKEYRTALITNAVTGKIDVRDVKLPELDSLEVA